MKWKKHGSITQALNEKFLFLFFQSHYCRVLSSLDHNIDIPDELSSMHFKGKAFPMAFSTDLRSCSLMMHFVFICSNINFYHL
jgi:hypothetical protein